MKQTGFNGTKLEYFTWNIDTSEGYFALGALTISTPAAKPFQRARITKWVDANKNNKKDAGEVSTVWESADLPGGSTSVSAQNVTLSTAAGTTALFSIEVDFGSGYATQKEQQMTNSSSGNRSSSKSIPQEEFLTAYADMPSDHRLSFYKTTSGKLRIEVGKRTSMMVAGNGVSTSPIPIVGVAIFSQSTLLDYIPTNAPGGTGSKEFSDTFSNLQINNLSFVTFGIIGTQAVPVYTIEGSGIGQL